MVQDISSIVKQTQGSKEERYHIGYNHEFLSPPKRIGTVFRNIPGFLRRNPEYSVLDIGSCWGRSTRYMQDRYGLVIGMERADEPFLRAKANYPDTSFIQGDGYYPHLYFQEDSFNIVFMLNLLEWIDQGSKDIKKVLDNVKKVMAPKSYFICAELDVPMTLGFDKCSGEVTLLSPKAYHLTESARNIATSFGLEQLTLKHSF
jgi:ubiquinone/menaquinone biosynthesis C-methylase UbiE